MIEDVHHDNPGKWMCSRYGCNHVSEVDTEMGVMCREHVSPLLFPIQVFRNARYEPWFCPWEFVKPHEKQAEYNHGQSLARLANRGGLSFGELRAVLHGRGHDARTDLSEEKSKAVVQVLLDQWWVAQRAV